MVAVIPDKLYFKIGEVCKITGVEPYILRYWESEFKLVKPYGQNQISACTVKKTLNQF